MRVGEESNVDLKKRNTFKISCMADKYYEFSDVQELEDFAGEYNFYDEKYFILGGGSNVLLPDNFNGVVIHPISKDVKTINDSASIVDIEVGAGMEWDDLVSYTVSRGYSGLERLALIPGNVGASPIQNIGAYGSEVSEYIEKVICFDLYKKKKIELSKDQCCFCYRSSLFKSRPELLVTSVVFRLFKSQLSHMNSEPYIGSRIRRYSKDIFRSVFLIFKSIRIGSDTNWRIKMNFLYVRDFLSLSSIPLNVKSWLVRSVRRATMPNPLIVANVGCFFKSPLVNKKDAEIMRKKYPEISIYPEGDIYKISAGDLIKGCGLNGMKAGSISIDKKRPLVILNHGNATGSEIFIFSEEVRKSVMSKYGINIQREVVVV